MNRALIIGCSNLMGQHKTDAWKKRLSTSVVYNRSQEGAGNKYIFDQLLRFLDTNKKPDYVYLQFSGLFRVDFLSVTDNGLKLYPYVIKDASSPLCWILSGGKLGSWQHYTVSKKIFLPFYIHDDNSALVFNSLNCVYSAISVLELLNIPYNYTFYYNIFNPPTEYIENQEGKIDQLDNNFTGKFLHSFPHDYCFEKNALEEDGIHFKNFAYTEWLDNLKLEVDK